MVDLRETYSTTTADLLDTIAPNNKTEVNHVLLRRACCLISEMEERFMEEDQDGNGIQDFTLKTIGKGSLADAGKIQFSNQELKAVIGQDAPPESFRGYFFKILCAQGKNAPGGEFSYLVNGKMIKGYALIAFPKEYPTSGKRTFALGYNGISKSFFSKDLGDQTKAIIEKMREFNPDSTWSKEKPAE